MLKIHREGRTIITRSFGIYVLILIVSILLFPKGVAISVAVLGLIICLFVMRFFRVPNRVIPQDSNYVFSPADGTVVVVEQTQEDEYLNERRIQVSVFMSVWNVHINWFPMAGEVEYFKHHHGKFLVAWHPKSSEENERTTTVVSNGDVKILFRQIAGMVARRIVSYAKVGEQVSQNSQCGFIKFGSRVDLFLPLDSEVCVKLGDKVVGTQTIIAKLNSKSN